MVVYLCLAVVNGSFFKNNNTLSTAKSLIGIVGTTTIMHHITDVGTALIPGIPDGSTTSTSLILSRGGIPSAASVVLGTAFVMVSGSVASTSRCVFVNPHTHPIGEGREVFDHKHFPQGSHCHTHWSAICVFGHPHGRDSGQVCAGRHLHGTFTHDSGIQIIPRGQDRAILCNDICSHTGGGVIHYRQCHATGYQQSPSGYHSGTV